MIKVIHDIYNPWHDWESYLYSSSRPLLFNVAVQKNQSQQ